MWSNSSQARRIEKSPFNRRKVCVKFLQMSIEGISGKQPEYLVVERHVTKRVAWATHEEEEEDSTVKMEPCGMSADLNRRKVVITGKENETGNKRRSVF